MSNERFSVGRRGFGIGLASLFFAAKAAELSGTAARAQDSSFKGLLYPIGGNADTSLWRFCQLAGGEKAKICILPHSSASPKETVEELQNTLMAFGVKNTKVLLPESHPTELPDCTAIFMTGGDQSRMMRIAENSLLQKVREFARAGNLVGGTSAGAAIMAAQMIAGGMGDGMPKSHSLLMNEGLGLLPGYVVDTHVSARSRHDRLMVALSLVPGVKGIGLDEDTAVEVKDGKATVWGKGVAHVYRRADDFKSAIADKPDGVAASVQNMIYSIYPAGETFAL